MSLIKVSFGGTIWSAGSAGTPVDEWSNTIFCIGPSTPTLTQAIVDDLALLVHTWFQSVGAGMSNTVSLDFVKVNEIDITTGHQITDPTMEHAYAPGTVRGSSGSGVPVTTAYRVSVDDGTRNKSARGGWFAPRPSLPVLPNGRFDSTNVSDAMAAAANLLIGLRDYATLNLTPAVYSRKLKSAFPIHRVRVGDVPDNVRSRKDDMIEAYAVDNEI